MQDGIGYRKDKPVITLRMEAYLGAPESYDTVTIEGPPCTSSASRAGPRHRDRSIAVNAVPQVPAWRHRGR
jgi:hypothetical protein